METGGILLWTFLTDSIKELKFVNMENSLNNMREISKKKTALKVTTMQFKEVVEARQKLKEEIHEVMLKMETNIFQL